MEMISALLLRPLHTLPGEAEPSTSRQRVGRHMSARAGGVDQRVAQQRTNAFYRSSGQRWTLALA
jgi:hypothetical protein